MNLNKVLAAIAGSALVVVLGAMPSFAGSASGIPRVLSERIRCSEFVHVFVRYPHAQVHR